MTRPRVRFTNRGLVPEYECYNNCSKAWGLLHQQQFTEVDCQRKRAAQQERKKGRLNEKEKVNAAVVILTLGRLFYRISRLIFQIEW